MNSIGEDCQDLKTAYDHCFNKWFSKQFLKGNRKDPCKELFNVYQNCVKVFTTVGCIHNTLQRSFTTVLVVVVVVVLGRQLAIKLIAH